jgi:hypothetical protein
VAGNGPATTQYVRTSDNGCRQRVHRACCNLSKAIAAKDTDADVRYQQTVSGFPGFGYYYWYPYTSVGVSSTTSETRYAAQADVVMFKGEKRGEDTRAFNAAELKANLDALVIRPQPQ